MDSRFHSNRWRMTGVIPRGAQVRRVTGSSETPDSSQKTMTALRRRAFLPDPRPVALHPPLDGLLVALDGPAGGALQPPAQPAAQQLPHMTGVVGDPGDLLDHRGDARKGAVVGVEAVPLGALSEGMADRLKLSLGQTRSVPGRSGTVQRLRPARAPAPMPAADVLPRDAESAGDLGLGAAGGEQLAGLETDTFEGLAVTQTTGVAAVSGWSHAAMLPGQPQSCHRKGRTSLAVVCWLRWQVEVQRLPGTNRLKQQLQLGRRGHWRPRPPPACEHDPRGQPGAHPPQRHRPGHRRGLAWLADRPAPPARPPQRAE